MSTHIFNNNNYYWCGFNSSCCGCYSISKLDSNSSSVNNYITQGFENISTMTLTGKENNFTAERLIAIEMK